MNSLPQSERLAELRTLLVQRFPEAHQGRMPNEEIFDSGLRGLETIPWQKGSLLEFVNAPGFGYGALIMTALIEHLSAAGKNVTLIDEGEHFDPENLGETACQHLFWLRCKTLTQSIQATDWMLRDGNISSILLDLQFCKELDLQRLPTSLWYRLRQLAERRQMILGVWTPCPLIPSVTQRLTLHTIWPFEALDVPREKLLSHMTPNISPHEPSPPRGPRIPEALLDFL